MRSLGSISQDLCEMQRLRDHSLELGAKDLEWQRQIVGTTASVAPANVPTSSTLPCSLSEPSVSFPMSSTSVQLQSLYAHSQPFVTTSVPFQSKSSFATTEPAQMSLPASQLPTTSQPSSFKWSPQIIQPTSTSVPFMTSSCMNVAGGLPPTVAVSSASVAPHVLQGPPVIVASSTSVAAPASVTPAAFVFPAASSAFANSTAPVTDSVPAAATAPAMLTASPVSMTPLIPRAQQPSSGDSMASVTSALPVSFQQAGRQSAATMPSSASDTIRVDFMSLNDTDNASPLSQASSDLSASTTRGGTPGGTQDVTLETIGKTKDIAIIHADDVEGGYADVGSNDSADNNVDISVDAGTEADAEMECDVQGDEIRKTVSKAGGKCQQRATPIITSSGRCAGEVPMMSSSRVRGNGNGSGHLRGVGKIRRHRMTKEEEARFNPADLVDLTGSTAAKSRKMTDVERDIMLHKRRLRNRASAARSRDKQRKTVHELSDEMDELMCMSRDLLKRCIAAEKNISKFEATIESLTKENALLKQAKLSASQSSPSSLPASRRTLPSLSQSEVQPQNQPEALSHFQSQNQSHIPLQSQTQPRPSTQQPPAPTLAAPSASISTPPLLQRSGSLLHVSMSSDMLDKIMGAATSTTTDGAAHLSSRSPTHNSLVRIPSKLHVSLSTDRLQDFNFPFSNGPLPPLSRNVSVVEHLLDLTNYNGSLDFNCDVQIRD